MKTLRFFIGLMALVMITGGMVQAYDVNKDIKNLGANGAVGIKVVMTGNETVTETFDGYSSGQYQGTFNPPAVQNQGGNTSITWTGFSDTDDNVIGQNQVIHVGWSTSDNSNEVVKIVWTDAQGNELPGGYENVEPAVSSGGILGGGEMVNMGFRNLHSPGSLINIRNIRWYLSPNRIPLADLNPFNQFLEVNLMPLPGGEVVDLPPGADVNLMLPQPVPPGFYVVLVYNIEVAGSDMEAIDFIQFNTEWDIE